MIRAIGRPSKAAEKGVNWGENSSFRCERPLEREEQREATREKGRE